MHSCMVSQSCKIYLLTDHSIVISISRGSLIAADLIVIIVTLATTYKTVAMTRKMLNGKHNRSLSFLLLWDGIMYFM